MLNENLKNIRRSKGLSQEELAAKVNVVRQTVSKWEKGLSVPDCEMLVTLSEALDVPVAQLLGEAAEEKREGELSILAAKLELLNSQFARQAEQRRRRWHIFFVVLGAAALCLLLYCLAAFFWHQAMLHDLDASVSIIGGADGPTSIVVTSMPKGGGILIFALVAVGVALAGFIKTRGR